MSLSNLFLSDRELGKLFISILCLLVSSHSFGHLFDKYHLPRVAGEILGGIILGPSVLGVLWPSIQNDLFYSFPVQGKILSFLHWNGLLFLMFIAGFKFNMTYHKKDHLLVIYLTLCSTVFPLLGALIYYKLYNFYPYLGPKGTPFSLGIVICISVAITSIPVISKMFIDLNLIQTRFAKIVLASAVLHDLILWLALDIAFKASSAKDVCDIFLGTLVTILFLLFFLIVGPKLVNAISQEKYNFLSRNSPVFYLLAVFYFFLILSHSLGINMIFGALVAGILVNRVPINKLKLSLNTISNFVLSFFVPLYFAIVGLKLNLATSFHFTLFLSFFIVSSFIEITSVAVCLRLSKYDWLSSLNFGLAMNTKGGPGIMIASMAYEFGLIDEILCVVLVFVAIGTSIMSGTWFKHAQKRGWLF